MPVLTSSLFMIGFYIINTLLHLGHLTTMARVQDLPHNESLHEVVRDHHRRKIIQDSDI